MAVASGGSADNTRGRAIKRKKGKKRRGEKKLEAQAGIEPTSTDLQSGA